MPKIYPNSLGYDKINPEISRNMCKWPRQLQNVKKALVPFLPGKMKLDICFKKTLTMLVYKSLYSNKLAYEVKA